MHLNANSCTKRKRGGINSHPFFKERTMPEAARGHGLRLTAPLDYQRCGITVPKLMLLAALVMLVAA
jgi:hypothetical protein